MIVNINITESKIKYKTLNKKDFINLAKYKYQNNKNENINAVYVNGRVIFATHKLYSKETRK